MPGLFILFATAWLVLVVAAGVALAWRMTHPPRRTVGNAVAAGCPTEPGELGLEGEAVTFNLSDGSASPGFIVEGHDPAGPVAVVLHGYSDSRFGSLYRAELLAPWVSHTVVFDLPGHGDAAAPLATFGAREPADVLAVVDGLPPEVVQGRAVVLYGYSMGGQIAIKTAALHPRFAGVVAVSPYRFWDEALRRELRRRGVPGWPLAAIARWLLAVRWGRRATGFDRAADAAELRCPLLVIHGDEDALCPVEAGEALAAAAPDGRFVCIEGGGHRNLLGVDGPTFRDALAAFFQKLGVPPTTRTMDAPAARTPQPAAPAYPAEPAPEPSP